MAVMNSLRPDSVSFTTLPLFHIHALSALVQSLLTGAHCVISERFSASRFWAEACEARATHGCLVGAMGAMLLAQPPSAADRDHSIHTIFSSSLRSSVWAEFAQRFGIARRVGGYGSTETNAAFFAENGWDLQGRMGEVVPGFEARVIDPEGRDVPADTPGELLLRTELPEAFALGYWNQPEETAKSWRSGWFYTGDLVCRDQAGGYRFVGRLKESIRRRGENVSAWEVEQAVLSHPAIRDVAAFGVPSDIGDEDIMIVAVIREGHSITPETLLRHLDGRIAYFAIPRFVEFADRLPVTETGKLRRTELKQRGVGEHTFDREAIGWKVSRS
jgi:crotonobetaine/carnitine-CoA ligase